MTLSRFEPNKDVMTPGMSEKSPPAKEKGHQPLHRKRELSGEQLATEAIDEGENHEGRDRLRERPDGERADRHHDEAQEE